MIRVELPDVKQVTNIRTICTAMEAHANRSMLSEVHKLLRLFLTIPVTLSTSERSFSTMRLLLTYLRSSMTERRFNNCFILHVHKELAECINLEEVAKEFISRNENELAMVHFHRLNCISHVVYARVYVYEYNYLFDHHCPPKYRHPPPSLQVLLF